MSGKENSQVSKAWISISGDLRSFIFSMVRNDDQTEEILHEIFIKVHDKIDTLKESQKLRPWIFRIARNHIIDHFREEKKRKNIVYSDLRNEVVTIPGYFMSEAIKDLKKFINNLPDDYCEALCLTELEGLSQIEYAKIAGLSYSGAKSRVQRARLMLRNLLMQCCHYEFDRYGTVFSIKPNTSCCCCKD